MVIAITGITGIMGITMTTIDRAIAD